MCAFINYVYLLTYIIAAADYAAPDREAEYWSLGLGYKLCAIIPVTGQRTHGTTSRAIKVTSQVATPGAESAVYDCFACFFNLP